MFTEPPSPIKKLPRLEVDGKFFRSIDHTAGREGVSSRAFLKMVTYGPFPDPQPHHHKELSRVAMAGFNAIRIYTAPSQALLDAAAEHGLWVFAGVEWGYSYDFIHKPSLLSGAMISPGRYTERIWKSPRLGRHLRRE